MRCPQVDPHPAHETAVRAGGVTYAGGRCPGVPEYRPMTLGDTSTWVWADGSAMTEAEMLSVLADLRSESMSEED